jgi:hypothetical protein
LPQDDEMLKVGDLVRIKIRYCNYSTTDDIGVVKAVDKDFYRGWNIPKKRVYKV